MSEWIWNKEEAISISMLSPSSKATFKWKVYSKEHLAKISSLLKAEVWLV